MPTKTAAQPGLTANLRRTVPVASFRPSVHSGTVSSLRVRGSIPPSYNVIEFDSEKVLVNLRRPGEGEQPFARFSRRAVTTSEIFPGLDYFVRYDEVPA